MLGVSSRFAIVEPLRTQAKLSLDTSSFQCSVVQAGSERLNHAKLMRNHRMLLALTVLGVSTSLVWFNHVELMRTSRLILALSSALLFKQVQYG